MQRCGRSLDSSPLVFTRAGVIPAQAGIHRRRFGSPPSRGRRVAEGFRCESRRCTGLGSITDWGWFRLSPADYRVSVSFCVLPCHSALEAVLDFQVFVQFQAGLTHFQGGFFRELCCSASSISMLRQSRVPARLPDGRGAVAGKHYGKATLPGLERG